MNVCETPTSRPRVLMIAPEFYPCQVIGAHRSSKFCKYLPQFGYDVSVLTIDPRKAGWAVDERLSGQIPEGTRRIETFYPFQSGPKEMARRFQRWWSGAKGPLAGGNGRPPVLPGELASAQAWLAVPDKDIFWTPWAIMNGLGPARQADVLYATAPQFSTLVIGALLKRMVGRPLVIDLRDPWTLSQIRACPPALHRRIDRSLERWTFRQADQIICNTESVRSQYQNLYPDLQASRFAVISNGYDEDDFADLPKPAPFSGKLRLGYFGKVYAGRDPGPLFRAARRAMDTGRIPAGTLEFVFYGPSGSIVAAVADSSGVADIVTLNSTIPYAEALRQMVTCDVLLIMGSPETDALHIPGKAFEYLAMRKPILALAGEGALADLMCRYEFGRRALPDDEEAVFEGLCALYEDVVAGRSEHYLGADYTRLSRRWLTGELAALFDRLCRPARADDRRSEGCPLQAARLP